MQVVLVEGFCSAGCAVQEIASHTGGDAVIPASYASLDDVRAPSSGVEFVR
jgi:hypothetical protein